jgi:hypothetical protein
MAIRPALRTPVRANVQQQARQMSTRELGEGDGIWRELAIGSALGIVGAGMWKVWHKGEMARYERFYKSQ